ncbi:MAG: hypothetical protein AMXMBFR79_12050 [Chitinophagaceae bacterium]
MDNQNQPFENNNQKDFTKSWVSSSKFLFYLFITGMILSSFGGCFRLYQQRYKGKPDIQIQSSTKYTPEYK